MVIYLLMSLFNVIAVMVRDILVSLRTDFLYRKRETNHLILIPSSSNVDDCFSFSALSCLVFDNGFDASRLQKQ